MYLLIVIDTPIWILYLLPLSEILRTDHLVISYDIACQWHKNLPTHMDTMTPEYRLELDNYDIALYPNFTSLRTEVHAKAGSLSTFVRTWGAPTAKNIERGWAWLNPASLSTREMGPGARQDALDDQWSF